MKKPRYVPLTPQIQEAALKQIEDAADIITNVGHVIRPALGAQWDRKSRGLWEKIMNHQYAVKQAFIDDRLARAQGKGTRAPDGERRERNFQRPVYRDIPE